MLQGLTTNSSDSFLLADNYPSWLADKSEGPSVLFQVPEDSDRYMKGITLCVLYSSTHENLATECLPSVLIINYTKFTIQIYKRDTVMSFNDEDWQSMVSNLGVGDNVEIFVAIGHGLTVKETAVYLIYDPSTNAKMEPEPSPAEEGQKHHLKRKYNHHLLWKLNHHLLLEKNINCIRLIKRVGECLCLIRIEIAAIIDQANLLS
jgi:hypothetical protein